MGRSIGLFCTAPKVPHLRRQPHTIFPLDACEGEAIGWVKPFVDHYGPDEVWSVDRLTRPAKRIEDAARQLSLCKPEIRLADSLRPDRLRLHSGSKQTGGSVEMNQIGAKLAELLFCSGDHAGNLSPFVDQRRHDVTFRHNPSSIPKRSRALSSPSRYIVSPTLGVLAP